MESSDSDLHSSPLLDSGAEKEYGFQRPRPGFFTRHRKPLLWSGLGFLNVLAIIIIYLSANARSRHNSFASDISYNQVLFTPDDRFVQSWGPHSPWNELIPLGKGFVKVSADQQQGLGRGQLLDDGSLEYCLSVFHQLHCVAMIRNTINNLREGKPESHHNEPGQDPLGHVDHCIDYLRQAVMCSGDMTLEHYKELDNGTLGSGVDGYFVNHQCKSWDQIMIFATEHRSRDISGIV